MSVVETAPADPMAAPMALLASGVPLSLLLDLAFGPSSEDLLRREQAVVVRPRHAVDVSAAGPT